MKVGINGGDITGLVVARIMREAGHVVRVFEPGQPGRSALIPRFKYLERSKEVSGLLDRLGVAYGEYALDSGIMLHGQIVPVRRNMTESVQHAYWSKTRLVSAPAGEVKGVTDPEVGPKRHAITVDWADIRIPLIRHVTIEPKRTEEAFDLLIETGPLWESPFVAAYVDAMAVTLNLVLVKSVRDPFLRWDLVYTPFTPADCIHRVYHYADGYVCEFSGAMNEDRLASDLNFLFPHGYYVAEIQQTHGHLLPLAAEPDWPANVHPIGRLSQWDESVTITRVIQEATALARNANP